MNDNSGYLLGYDEYENFEMKLIANFNYAFISQHITWTFESPGARFTNIAIVLSFH